MKANEWNGTFYDKEIMVSTLDKLESPGTHLKVYAYRSSAIQHFLYCISNIVFDAKRHYGGISTSSRLSP